jgi:hypothetical protein
MDCCWTLFGIFIKYSPDSSTIFTNFQLKSTMVSLRKTTTDKAKAKFPTAAAKKLQQQKQAAARAKKAAELEKKRLQAPPKRVPVGTELESESSDGEDAQPDYKLWRALPKDNLLIVSVDGIKSKRMPVSDALALVSKLRGAAKCKTCLAHPHCGAIGHLADDCGVVDPSDPDEVLCVCCLEEQAIDLCERCGILACSQCIRVGRAVLGQADPTAICKICELAVLSPAVKPKPARKRPLGETLVVSDSEDDQAVDPNRQLSDVLSTNIGVGKKKSTTRMVASTGKDSGVTWGMRGMDVTPTLRSDRPVMPADMLVCNTAQGKQAIEDGTTNLVWDGTQLKAKQTTTWRNCNSMLEWSAGNLRLKAYLIKVNCNMLDETEEGGYDIHTLKITDLAMRKEFMQVLMYDWMVRMGVW